MQVQHKAVTEVQPVDPVTAVLGDPSGPLGQTVGSVILLGIVAFGAFVVYRFFRWFFRVTR